MLRKVAGAFLVLGLALGALGAGVAASFTDNAHADMSITVGTFDIVLTSAQGQVSNDGDTVTYGAPTIDRSGPDSALFKFTIHNQGSMAAVIHISATAVPAPFHDYLVAHPVANFMLDAGDSQEITAGLTWTELGMSDLSDTYSITYTIAASA